MDSRSASHCYSSALSDLKREGYRPGSQFLFDNFNTFLTTSLAEFSPVRKNLSSIGGISLNSR